MKTVVVLGGNGFIGKKLVEELRKQFLEVIAPTSKEVDLRNQSKTMEFFERFSENTIVFFLAAKVGGIKANMADPYHFLVDNLLIQNNVVNSCLSRGIKKMVFLGSSCIYPKDYPQQPLKEEYLLKGIPEPTNEGYALAKICGLKICEYANKQFGTEFISLMPSNVYGPQDHFNLDTSHALAANVKKIVDAKHEGTDHILLWGTGIAEREWLYVDDLVDCIIWSINNLKETKTFLNVGTGISISMFDMVKLICELVGFKGEIRLDKSKPDGMLKKCLDVSKINSLGWMAKTNLKDGIKNTIDYYESIRGKENEHIVS